MEATQHNESTASELAISARKLNLWYGTFQALFDIDLDIKQGRITSMIGPSGCGKSTFLRTVNRIVCRAGQAVFVNNAGLRDEVVALGAREVKVIGTPLPSAFIGRPTVPISPSMHRVCFAGRLAPEKNVEEIVAAARAMPDVEFVIAGDGPRRNALVSQARGCHNIRFVGWLSREQLIDLIDSSSLLLQPSSFETFGSVALEAMARGRPALVSVQSGIYAWPTLHDGLVPMESPPALLPKLRELQALSPAAWTGKSVAARDLARELNSQTIRHWAHLLDYYNAHGATTGKP